MKWGGLTSLTSALLALACSNSPVQKSCGSSTGASLSSFSVTGNNTGIVPEKQPALVGGFIQFHLEKEPDQVVKNTAHIFSDSTDPRCSAMFRFTDVAGKPGAEITTAAHCFKGIQGLIQSMAVDIFDPGTQKYFPSLQVYSPFIEKRNLALDELAKAGFSSKARETVAAHFLAGYANIYGGFDKDILNSCSIANTADVYGPRQFYQKPNNSSLCFTSTDMAVIEVQFESADGTQKPSTEFSALLAKLRSAQDVAMNLAGLQSNAAMAKQFYAANRQWALDKRDYGLGDYIDYMALGCENTKKTGTTASSPTPTSAATSADPNDPNALILDFGRSLFAPTANEIAAMKVSMTDICPQVAKFRSILDKHVTFRGKPADEMEKELDFTDPIGMGPGWEQLNKYSRENLRSQMPDLNSLVALEQSNIDLLKLHFNLVSLDRSNVQYASVKVKDISNAPSLLDFVWPKRASTVQSLNSVFINLEKAPTNTANFDFSLGDSGTILSWSGAFPIYVLAVVDKKPSSGGASLINLPRRKTSDTDSGQAGSADNGGKDKKRDTANCAF